MKNLVIIPTYNEAENIRPLMRAIRDVSQAEILVVDDNSPDGTAGVVRSHQSEDSRVHLLVREKKEGIGRAYIAGFQWGLARGFDSLIEMDADFSHRPVDLCLIEQTLQQHDFVVGSRWVKGGATRNWGLLRKIISRGGSLYSRLILGFPVKDWTGGFNGWRRKVLEGIALDKIRSDGYSFQIEMKYKALKASFRGTEVPIIFEERRLGQSKMSLKIVLEALYKVWGIR